MKRILPLIALSLISFIGFSQTKGISYQAVIIDPNPIEIPGKDVVAQPYVSKDVWIRFGIYAGTTLQYEELHKTKTDEYGLVNLIIGGGVNTGKAGTFTSLSWDGITKNIVTNVSFDQGGRYTEVSNQKLTYVPYTLLAETAVKLAGVLPIASGGTGATNAIAARTNLGLGNVDNTADADKPVSIATLAILDTKESLANKSTNIIADSASSVKYPSVKAIKEYIDSRNSLSAQQANLAARATALATPRTINGVPFDGTGNITIPVGVTPADADATTKGLVKLAGDLTGTADAPAIAAAAVTTAKIADGAVTDGKITSVSGSKVTGNITGNSANVTGTVAIANGGTGATTASGARTNLGLAIGTDVLAQRTFGTAANSAATDFVAVTEKGANNGVATLGVNGKIPSVQIPSISFQSVSVVNSDATMIAIAGAQVGSIAIRSDLNINYVLSALPATTLSNWIQLAASTDVSTINGIVGPSVNLTTTEIPEGNTNKYYTDARVRSALSATGPLALNASTGVISMTAASGSSDGYLSSADFTTFNNKQTALTAGVDYATPSGNITGNAANVTGIVAIANGGTGASTAGAALTNLGAEPTSNKSNDILVDGSSTTKFPTFKAIKDYVDQQSANAGVADNSITSAKINGNLAVLKGGTGASTAAGARTNLGLVIGTDVMAANATTALTGDVSGSGNGSFATTVNSVGGVSSSTIATLPGLITTNTNAIAANTTSITANATAIATNTTSIATNVTAITSEATTARAAELTLTNSVNANTASITANTNSIATLNTNVAANTASITANASDILLKAPLASPTFTGTPTAPTPATSDNSTALATTEYVKASITAANAGLSSIGAISGTSNAKGATISGTTELILTPADATNGGVVTTGAQTFAGSKTFTNTVTFGKNITVNGMSLGTPTNSALSPTQNTIFGVGVLSNYAPSLSSHDYNTGIGFKALFNQTLGGRNTATGASALYALTTGKYNSGYGQEVLVRLTNGSFNTAVGNTAGGSLINTSDNTMIGAFAGNNVTGSNNIFLGSNNSAATTDGSGITTGSNNTIIGSGIRGLAATLSNNIVLADGQGNIRAQHDGTTGWTLGTITSGTWSATTIDISKGGTGATTAAAARTNLGLVIGIDVMAANYTTTLTGDVTGAGNGSFATTLAASGVNSGTYGSSTAIPVLTVDTKGRVTSASTVGIIAGVNSLNYTSTSYAAGGTISGTSLTLAAADATNPGLISTGAQTIAGAKTFSTDITAPNFLGNATTATTAGNITATSNTTLTSLSNLATVGTITSGIWSATTIDVAHGGTGLTSLTAGYIPFGNGTGALSSSSNLTWDNANKLLMGVYIGKGADNHLTNLAYGWGALNANNGGTYNTALGLETLNLNTTGSYNAAVGYQSLLRNTTGANNTGTGYFSLINNTSGNKNSAFGMYGLAYNTTSDESSAFGYSALINSTGGYNSAFGSNALSTNVAGTKNTAIGAGADVISAALTNATAIGYGAVVGASNTIKLGNADVTSVVTSGTISATGFTGPLTGNASTATKLAATKNINGIAFDGSADITIAADANTLTGTTLASNVTASSLTSVGTITSGTWSATTIDIAKGGTGATTAAAALTNLGAQSVDNMSTNITTDAASIAKYPSVKLIKDYVDGRVASAGVSDGSITNVKLANSTTILGSTTMTLGGTVSSVTGLTSLAATNLTGTLSGTATALATGRTISTTGDVEFTTGAFDGTSNVTGSATLTNTTVTAGAYGSSTAIPTFTVDSKGRLTAAGTVGITAGVSTLAYSTTGASNGGTISGTSLTLTAADATNPGLISTGAQTIAGAKTFNSDVTATNFLGNATTATTAGNITATSNTSLTSLANLATVGTITSGVWSGTEVAIAKGGTGATTAAGARTNLGLGSLATSSSISNADVASGAAIAFSKLNITRADISGLGIQDGLTAGSGISLSSGTISVTGLTTSNLASNAAITNGQLVNSSTTLGSTTMTLGGTVTSVIGLESVTSTGFTGALTGNASTATKLATGRTIALTGDVTYTSPTFDGSGNVTAAATLANSGVSSGTYGSAISIPTLTVDEKGRITSAGSANIIANAGTLTGTSLNATVTGSSLTGVATITSGTWNGSTIGVAYGGTGLTSPGTSGNILTSNGTGWVSQASTDVASLGTFTTTSYAKGGTISGTVLTLSAADATNPGLVTTGAQTFVGAKTFSSTVTASSGSAVGTSITSKLTAAAANDVLVGLDINSTFVPGAYTPSMYAMRVNGTANFLKDVIVNGNTFGTGSLSGNIAIGPSPLVNNTLGAENIAIGNAALRFFNPASSSNTFNIAIGSSALGGSSNTGTNNIAIGNNALGQASVSGMQNIGIGVKALYNNTSGNYNTAIGEESMSSGTNTSNENSAFGFYSLKGNTGANNSGFGSRSLQNTTGNWNSGLGSYALLSNTSGGYNLAAGGASLRNLTTGNYNIGLGYQAGYINNTTGTGSVFLGFDTRPLNDGDINEVVISGYNGNGSTAGMTGNGSNTVTIGNSANTANYLTGVTNVNTGTLTATTGFNLTGSVNDFLEYNVKNSSTGTSAQSGYNAMANNGTDAVNFAWMGINNSTFNNPQTYNIGVANDVSFLGAGNDMYVANANNTKSIIFSTGISTTPYFSEKMRITATGNVGIGTNSPTANLHVAGTVRIVDTNQAAGKVLTSDASGNATWSYAKGVTTTTASTTYAISLADAYVFYTGTAAGAFTIPAAASGNAGKEVLIKNKTAFGITITPSSTGNIYIDKDNTAANTVSIGIEASNNWIKLVSDGTQWNVIRALF